jgi:hypothetical protein
MCSPLHERRRIEDGHDLRQTKHFDQVVGVWVRNFSGWNIASNATANFV